MDVCDGIDALKSYVSKPKMEFTSRTSLLTALSDRVHSVRFSPICQSGRA